MSPVFGHGRLRLYLLKLLDEAPRHGYEVIRLLQDRFMGVYAPSPGTIYPRLARLEEEGLLTHDEKEGRKIYRITDKGREEINRRLDELNDLEREITESVSGIAREVKEDVRETVRNLREELTWATREMHSQPRPSAHEQAREAREQAREHARRLREEIRGARDQTGERDRDQTRERGRQRDDEAAADREWGEWAGWREWARWTEWPGRRRRPGRDRGDQGREGRDFETVAKEFASEVRSAIRQAGALGEGAMEELRLILEDSLERIRSEVFGPVKTRPGTARAADEGGSSETTEAPEPAHAAKPAEAAEAGGPVDSAEPGELGEAGKPGERAEPEASSDAEAGVSN